MKQLPWIILGALISAAIGAAVAQQGAQTVVGCIVNSAPPTFTAGQIAPLQCDTNGKLHVNTT